MPPGSARQVEQRESWRIDFPWSSLPQYAKGNPPAWLAIDRVLDAFRLSHDRRGRSSHVAQLVSRQGKLPRQAAGIEGQSEVGESALVGAEGGAEDPGAKAVEGLNAAWFGGGTAGNLDGGRNVFGTSLVMVATKVNSGGRPSVMVERELHSLRGLQRQMEKTRRLGLWHPDFLV
jgi:hypothetical protein